MQGFIRVTRTCADNKKSPYTFWCYCLFYIIGAVIGLAALVIIMAPILPAVGNMVNRFVNADGGELSNGRIWFWEFALEKFRQSPVFGIGWGGFKHYYHMRIGDYSSTGTTVDAHNVYLQILCEMGIVGFVVFLCAVSSICLGV